MGGAGGLALWGAGGPVPLLTRSDRLACDGAGTHAPSPNHPSSTSHRCSSLQALGFLNYLMLGTAAAPLRKALNDSGLGESIIGGGVEDELRQPVFSLGLKARPPAPAPCPLPDRKSVV